MTQDSTDRGVGEATPPPPIGFGATAPCRTRKEGHRDIGDLGRDDSDRADVTTPTDRGLTSTTGGTHAVRSPGSPPGSTPASIIAQLVAAQRASREGSGERPDRRRQREASRVHADHRRHHHAPGRRPARSRRRASWQALTASSSNPNAVGGLGGHRLVGRQPHVQRRPPGNRGQRPLREHLHQRHRSGRRPTPRSCSRPAGRRSASRHSRPTTRSRSGATRSP